MLKAMCAVLPAQVPMLAVGGVDAGNAATRGATRLLLYENEQPRLRLWLSDEPRPEAAAVTRALGAQGWHLRLARGDNHALLVLGDIVALHDLFVLVDADCKRAMCHNRWCYSYITANNNRATSCINYYFCRGPCRINFNVLQETYEGYLLAWVSWRTDLYG